MSVTFYPPVLTYTNLMHRNVIQDSRLQTRLSIRGLFKSLPQVTAQVIVLLAVANKANHNLSFVLRMVPLQCHVNYMLAAVNCSVASDAINSFWKHWY